MTFTDIENANIYIEFLEKLIKNKDEQLKDAYKTSEDWRQLFLDSMNKWGENNEK